MSGNEVANRGPDESVVGVRLETRRSRKGFQGQPNPFLINLPPTR
jgi:hypothetical protein